MVKELINTIKNQFFLKIKLNIYFIHFLINLPTI